MIKKADKGGAIVFFEKRHTWQKQSDTFQTINFYKKMPHDGTEENNETVAQVVNQEITASNHPDSAVNLIIDKPRCSVLYLAPKIHKPVNPGRPIVCACSCPT